MASTKASGTTTGSGKPSKMISNFALDQLAKDDSCARPSSLLARSGGAKPEMSDFASPDSVVRAREVATTLPDRTWPTTRPEPTGKTIAIILTPSPNDIWCNRRSFTSSLPPFQNRSPKSKPDSRLVSVSNSLRGHGHRHGFSELNRPRGTATAL